MPLNKKSFIRYSIIDACLRNKFYKYPSREEIINKCEEKLDCKISVSTFEKDIYAMKNLSEPGYYAPIEYSRKNNGYFYSNKNYAISNIKMKEEDIDAIEFATAILKQYKDLPLLKNYASAIDKIMDVVNVRKLLNKNQFYDYIQLDKTWSLYGNKYLEPIIEAIKNQLVLKIYYKTFYAETVNTHFVHPYLLKEYKSRWYVIGLHEKYQDIIVLGLERIVDLEQIKDKKFKLSNFKHVDYYKNAIGVTVHKDNPKQILLEFTKEQAQYLITQPIHASQKIYKTSNTTITISLTLIVNYELKSLLLSWGNNVKIIKPLALREEINQTCKKCLNQYK